jgi:hypothetical protein
VLYENTDLRGRAPETAPALVGADIAACAADVNCIMASEAVAAALALARPRDVVLVLYEKTEPGFEQLARFGAVPVVEPTLYV